MKYKFINWYYDSIFKAVKKAKLKEIKKIEKLIIKLDKIEKKRILKLRKAK
jgi:hypothetical protein